MATTIEIPAEVHTFDGGNFKKRKTDEKGNPVVALDGQGNPRTIPVKDEAENIRELPIYLEEDADWLDIIDAFLRRFDAEKRQNLSLGDIDCAIQIKTAMRQAKDLSFKTMTLSDEAAAWLLSKLEKFGPGFYGLSLYEIVAPLRRAESSDA